MLLAPEHHFETHRRKGIQIYPLGTWGEAQLPWRAWLPGGEWNICVSVSQKITCCLVSQQQLTQLTSYSNNRMFHVVSKSWLRGDLNLLAELCLNVDLPPAKDLLLKFNSLQYFDFIYLFVCFYICKNCTFHLNSQPLYSLGWADILEVCVITHIQAVRNPGPTEVKSLHKSSWVVSVGVRTYTQAVLGLLASFWDPENKSVWHFPWVLLVSHSSQTLLWRVSCPLSVLLIRFFSFLWTGWKSRRLEKETQLFSPLIRLRTDHWAGQNRIMDIFSWGLCLVFGLTHPWRPPYAWGCEKLPCNLLREATGHKSSFPCLYDCNSCCCHKSQQI